MMIPFNKLIEREDDFQGINAGHSKYASTFDIYPLSQLDQLINLLSQQNTPATSILFIVDDRGNMWFAGKRADHKAGHRCPMHYQMTGLPACQAYCITAGVMVFSPDFKKIIRMSNLSCTFKPNFDSLKWAFAILLVNKSFLTSYSIDFDEQIILEEYPTQGGFQGVYHTLDMQEMAIWVNEVFGPEEQKNLLQIARTMRKVVYPLPAPGFFSKELTLGADNPSQEPRI